MPIVRLALSALLVGLSTVRISTSALTQAPGAGWILSPSPERVVKHLYWELFDQTEVWTRVVPRLEGEARPMPASLIFSVIVQGKRLTPDRIANAARPITVLAQPDPRAVLPVPSTSFTLTTDTGQRFDLMRQGAATIIATCDSCSSQAILAPLDASVFVALARATTITGDILGFHCVLEKADTRALADFGRATRLLQ
jgi:hypothetical protein